MKKLLAVLLCFVVFAGCGRKKPVLPGMPAPDSAEALMREGMMFLNAHRLPEAETKLRQALSKRPGLSAAHNALGLVYTYQNKIDAAITEFQATIQCDPRFYDAYNALGMLYTEKGEFDKARENLLFAANAADYFTPENAYTNLALLEMKAQRLDLALRYTDKGLLLNKNFAPLHNLRGMIKEKMGEDREAVKCYERAIATSSTVDVAVVGNLVRLQARMGDKTRARETLEQIILRSPDPVTKKDLIHLLDEIEKQ